MNPAHSSFSREQNPVPATPHESFLQRHPVLCYFGITFCISWTGALLVAAPHLLRREPLPRLTGILMFPAMLLGPSIASIVLTRLLDGPAGLRDLFARMFRFRFPMRWYAALLLPPFLVLSTLLWLKTFVSAAYTPNRFLLGLAFGVPAGFLEEIGWMGFAFPRMRRNFSAMVAAVLLGLLWSVWHWPVVDFLGTAVPHGSYWWPFFLSFTAAMTAMRVLIAWLYANTTSVFLCQLMHVFSTGSLVIFSPPRVSGAQEAFWYAAYAAALWLIVLLLARRKTSFPCPKEFGRVG